MPSFRNYLLSTAVGAARDGQSNRPRRGRSECSRWPQLPARAVDQRGRHPFRRPDQLDQEPPPSSNFTKLAGHGVVYPSAYTTAPSDSYPGMLAQVTGATACSMTTVTTARSIRRRIPIPGGACQIPAGVVTTGVAGLQPGADVHNADRSDDPACARPGPWSARGCAYGRHQGAVALNQLDGQRQAVRPTPLAPRSFPLYTHRHEPHRAHRRPFGRSDLPRIRVRAAAPVVAPPPSSTYSPLSAPPGR